MTLRERLLSSRPCTPDDAQEIFAALWEDGSEPSSFFRAIGRLGFESLPTGARITATAVKYDPAYLGYLSPLGFLASLRALSTSCVYIPHLQGDPLEGTGFSYEESRCFVGGPNPDARGIHPHEDFWHHALLRSEFVMTPQEYVFVRRRSMEMSLVEQGVPDHIAKSMCGRILGHAEVFGAMLGVDRYGYAAAESVSDSFAP